MEEPETKELPILVDNSEKFALEAKPDFKEEARSTIKYPLVGALLQFHDHFYVVTKELSRHRYMIKWRKGP